MVPRNLIFARPARVPSAGVAAFNPLLRSDPDVTKDAKAPWKDVILEGKVIPNFWFATLLSKHLVPFGVQQFNLVLLPLEVNDDGSLTYLSDQDIVDRGLKSAPDEWFWPAEQKWNELK